MSSTTSHGLFFAGQANKRRDKNNPGMVLLDESSHCAAYRRLNCVSLVLAFVRVTRPEEAFQAVFTPPRHDVNVQVRHLLADAVIHRDECAVSRRRRLDRATEELRVLEKRFDQVLRQISQSFVVLFRNQQAMTKKNGTMIEKGEGHFVFEDQSSGYPTADDLAEKASQVIQDNSPSFHFVDSAQAAECEASTTCVSGWD